MTTWIAFLRGINIGGHHKLPMKAFAALLTQLGAGDVRTYGQSGNAVFHHEQDEAAPLAARIGAAIAEAYGFEPLVVLRTLVQLERAAAANPFPDAAPDRLALYFLRRPPEQPDLPGIERIRAPSEAFRLDGATFYLHAPQGFDRSRLAARVPGLLGVDATARNWRTVTALLKMLRASD